jgi:biopolymer transport protein ExbD
MSANEGRERSRNRRESRAARRPGSQIPTAGMADIAFLLLIFFMVIVYEADRTVVDLPDSDLRQGSDEEAALVILVRAGDDPADVIIRFAGDVTQESIVVPNMKAVESEAAYALSRKPGKVFKIKADGTIAARTVTRVFDALIRAGADRVLMLTDQRAPDNRDPT